MSSNYTVQIDENECIGDSLDTINSNFASLDTQVSLLSTLPHTIVAFTCERNGIGTPGNAMAFGAGSTTGSVVMPLPGQIIAATLRVNGLENGIIKVSPRVIEDSGVGSTGTGITYSDDDRSMSFSAQSPADSISIVKNYSETRRVRFRQGARLSWIQEPATGTALSYQVTFYVYFTP